MFLNSKCLLILFVAAAAGMFSQSQVDVLTMNAVAEKMREFSTKYLQTVITKTNETFVTSPFSVALALYMLQYGSGGSTLEQLQRVLPLDGKDAGVGVMFQHFLWTEDAEFYMYNHLYADSEYKIDPDYEYRVRNVLRGGAGVTDFSNKNNAADFINAWIKRVTSDHINDVVSVDDFTEKTAAILVNALYLKAKWQEEFVAKHTANLPFHVTRDKIKSIPTMYKSAKLHYGTVPGVPATFVEIPYQGQDDLSMIIVRPDEIDGLANVVSKLRPEHIQMFVTPNGQKTIDLYLPKFKIATKLRLDDTLKELGVTNIFTDQADLSKIADKPMKIHKVLQNVYIEVDEKGNKAVPATGASTSDETSQEFKLDRPFLYFVMLKVPRLPIFAGAVSDPQY